MDYELDDRYKALGINYPDPKTMCKGQCEGIGFFPVHKYDAGFEKEWDEAHDKAHTFWHCIKTAWILIKIKEFRIALTSFDGWGKNNCDGYHFITCPDCNGTGKEVEIESNIR